MPHAERQVALEAQGAEVIYLPGKNADGSPTGKVDLHALVMDLGQREINEPHVEAGHKLNGSLLRSGVVDELLVYLAPQLLGTGAGMSNFGPLTELSQGIALEFTYSEMVGKDLRILARVAKHDRF
jgi:diaminohydroxyphosphoribosylaminopyrimidine deaminase/5-amino-6-(5-phosphoribosylamino)uracil reductase